MALIRMRHVELVITWRHDAKYSNLEALLRRVDRGVPALFAKIDINRSAVDKSICLYLSERQMCIF